MTTGKRYDSVGGVSPSTTRQLTRVVPCVDEYVVRRLTQSGRPLVTDPCAVEASLCDDHLLAGMILAIGPGPKSGTARDRAKVIGACYASRRNERKPGRHTLSPAEVMALEYDILTTEEAAALLRVHPDTLRRKAADWGVPHKRLGTEFRFSKQELLAWLRSYEAKNGTETKY